MNQNEEKIITDDAGQSICIQYKDFKQYIAKKDLKIEDIRRLTFPKKREFYLRWKHGSLENGANEEQESMLQKFLFDFKDQELEDVDPNYRMSLKLRREFDAYCFTVKQTIGLVSQEQYPAEVRAIAAQIGGKVYGYEYQ